MNNYEIAVDYSCKETYAIDEGIVGTLVTKGLRKVATHTAKDMLNPKNREKFKSKAKELRGKGADALRKAGGVGMNALTGGHYGKMTSAKKGAEQNSKDIAGARAAMDKAAANDAAARKRYEDNMANLSAQVDKEAKDRESRGAAARNLADRIAADRKDALAKESERKIPLTPLKVYSKSEELPEEVRKNIYNRILDKHQGAAEKIAGKNPEGKWNQQRLRAYSDKTADEVQAIRDSEATRRAEADSEETQRQAVANKARETSAKFISDRQKSRDENIKTAKTEKGKAIRAGVARGGLALAATAAGATAIHDHLKYGDALYRIHRMHDRRMERKLAKKVEKKKESEK